LDKGRLEAFSDGVIAILITIMVLGLVPPNGATVQALAELAPVFLAYVLSFVYLGIYWNNHHHLLAASSAVNGRVLWANLHLLFWLSLIPFATAWMGENGFAAVPVALYGVVLLAAGMGYYVLSRALLGAQPAGAPLAEAISRDRKGTASLVILVIAVPVSLAVPLAACALYVLIAAMWFVPDSRIERVLGRSEG
jgi:uncharacterized membrane protein